ncbi:hypothetical protein KKF32_01775 [Patescibacteria group bacterium]|nr:hypothetical protein [Patescibacteria group bacterium]
MRKKSYQFNHPKGFSFIEIVIVSALAFIILFVIYDIFLISQKANRLGDEKLELIQNGRIILDRLSRELRQTPDLVTELPSTKDEVGFPPANELQFQDGHDLEDIQYLRYYLNSQLLNRQRIVYYFFDEPETYVYWDSHDEFEDPPEFSILEEKTIAEYINNIQFYGNKVIYIDVLLNKNETNEHLFTGVWGRNTRQ